jgi:hypothetical protein
MRREMASEEPLIVSEIDRLILIDRECDLVTPNVSQLTYEGMIDEVFGINNSMHSLILLISFFLSHSSYLILLISFFLSHSFL